MSGISPIKRILLVFAVFSLAAMTMTACARASGIEVEPFPTQVNPETGIEYVSVDRFSDDAGTMLRRSENPDLPAPNEPIDFDNDFLGHALGPSGEDVQYYEFDVAPFLSAPVYAFVYESDPTRRVDGQSAVFDQIPGEDSYNDFWQDIF